MKSLYVVFILFLSMRGISSEVTRGCRKFAPNFIDPHCGISKDCYFDGENKQKTNNEGCRRMELNLPEFTEIRKGRCPRDKPPC